MEKIRMATWYSLWFQKEWTISNFSVEQRIEDYRRSTMADAIRNHVAENLEPDMKKVRDFASKYAIKLE